MLKEDDVKVSVVCFFQCMKVHPSQYQLVVQGLIEQHKPERCIVFMETKRK